MTSIQTPLGAGRRRRHTSADERAHPEARTSASPPGPAFDRPHATPPAAAAGLPALRGYQQHAVDAVVQGLSTSDRGQVWAACGTGKTLVAVHAARRWCPTGLVAVAVPSLQLLAQTLRVWADAGVVTHILAVCGDDSVTDAAVHLGDLPCPVTTQRAQISRWLRALPAGKPALVLVTNASVAVLGAGLRDAGRHLQLLIVDEAHHTAGWRGKRSAAIHHNDCVPARRRLYLTATPRRWATKQGHLDADVGSMDDPDLFGPVHYSYPFSRAIDDGWLDDYRVVVVGVASREARYILQTSDRTVPGALDAPLGTAAIQTALIRAATQYGLRRIIVFTSRVAQSREFAGTLPRALTVIPDHERPCGRLTVGHVDGTQSIDQREQQLSLLGDPPDDGWTVLCNARCLTEGIDVPAVDAVVFTHPKRSQTDVAQAVGRALRRNPHGSGIATVLVPVLMPDDPDDLSTDMTPWATVVQVLQALRAHDTDLATDLDTRRMNVTTGAPVTLPDRVVVNLPDGYDREDLLRQITVRILQHTTPGWLAGYAALKAFQARHGHVRVPTGHREHEVALDRWVAGQRSRAKAGRLSADRHALLAELGLDLDVSAWRRGIAAATAFHRQHGHLSAPADYQHDGVLVARWLKKCRSEYHAGRLDPARIAALDALGMAWRRQAAWDEGLAAVTAFHREHGHLRVAHGTRVNGIDVYIWLVARRADLRQGRLGAATKARLDAMGMVWDLRQHQWWESFAALRRFHRQHGHLRPGRETRYDGVVLRRFMIKMRRDREQGRLSAEQIAAADALGMRWDIIGNRTGTGRPRKIAAGTTGTHPSGDLGDAAPSRGRHATASIPAHGGT